MTIFAAGGRVINSGLLGLAIAAAALMALCLAQALERDERRKAIFQVASAVAAVLSLVVVVLVVLRFALLG